MKVESDGVAKSRYQDAELSFVQVNASNLMTIWEDNERLKRIWEKERRRKKILLRTKQTDPQEGAWNWRLQGPENFFRDLNI